jgi:heptosyltransferase III
MRPGAAILIVHPGALGDVLQAVPALLGLRATTGGASLVFAGQPRFGRLLVGLGVVQAARDFEGLGLSALFADTPLPDALADLPRRFGRIVSWFGSRDPTYPARLTALGAEAIVAPPVPGDEIPVWRHLVSTLAAWGVESPAPLVPLRAAGAGAVRDVLVVHPGGGGAWKQWPAARYARVIGALLEHRRLEVMVHQGPADAEAARGLLALLGDRARPLVEPELPELAAVLAGARVYLGGDSGISHLAATVGAPSVILFPPATRRRWGPWSPTAAPVELSEHGDDTARVIEELVRRVEAGAKPARGGLATGPAPE